MSGTELAALLGGVAVVLTPIGGAFAFLLTLVVNQSKDTVKELKEENDKLEKDRDYWRDRALTAERGGSAS